MNSFSEKQPHIGIDFGTTKTLVAEYDPVKMMAKPHKLGRGSFEMPTSIYATENGNLLFGDEADDDGITDLPNLIRRFKMKLGKPGMAHVGRKAGTAVELTTEYLANVKKQLETQVLHTSVERVILTVPAMFGPAQRKDLTTAAKQAGFKEVELLAEPVAAGIAYCDHHSDLSKQLRFIVVDWGGGTFDVAHVERNASGELRIHEDFVVGLDDIGGEVFDDELWTVASSALDAAGHGSLDRQPRAEWGKFRRDLSRAKERLSSQDSVNMTFTLQGGQSCKISLKREDFNNIIRPMVQKAASFVSQLLIRAQNAGHPPEFILLAGGTSRIPMIREELEKITGVECRQWSEGREAIGLGASIKAHQKWGLHTSLPRDDNEAAMTQYRTLLEAAWLDKKITLEEREFLETKRNGLGLTHAESRALQIQVLGEAIEDIVGNSTSNFSQITKTDNGFALIPAGIFEMGDSLDSTADATVHSVNVSAFYLAKHEATKALWDQVRMWCLTHGYKDALPSGKGKLFNHPVHSVDWDSALKWCNAYSEKDGLIPCYSVGGTVFRTGSSASVVCNWAANGYRLPTEAEWEKAARGGLRGKRFPWGDTISHGQANFANCGKESYQTGTTGYHSTYGNIWAGGCPSPVGSFAPNGYGLFDMAGNVREWCWDCYGAYPSTSQTDPRGATSGSRRVTRGGCCQSEARFCTVTFRSVLRVIDHVGFRLARSVVT